MPANTQNDPDGLRLPIKIDSTSNGEFKPVPLTRANHEANHEAWLQADRKSVV